MEMIELARLWIAPEVQSSTVVDRDGAFHSLPIASAAIGRALRRVRSDWVGKYPHLPELRACVAWSDDTLHAGTIYRATNFSLVGSSGGTSHRNRQRPNGGRDQLHQDYLNVKSAYVYEFGRPLSRASIESAIEDWDSRRPRRRVLQPVAPLSSAPVSVTTSAIDELSGSKGNDSGD